MQLQPVADPRYYQTYQVAAPLGTHWTAATCEQVDCEHWREGWAVRVEHLDARDLHLVKTAGRKFVEQQIGPGETWLVFEAGQPCFRAGTHVRRIEKPELFILRGGDHRGDPTGRGPIQLSPESWTDDFGEHQDNISQLIERG